ncbi:MAG: hypothetical protein AAGI48_06865 [Verrucomicrobiota bacterium]
MSGAPETEEPRRSRWVAVVLVVLPLWLFVSAGIGLWLWYKGHTSEEAVEPSKFATPIEAKRLTDDMRKLVEIIGERQVSSELGAKGLSRAASMIEGSLGPSNAGYRVELEGGPKTSYGSWPVITATLPGDGRNPLWVVAAYDTRGDGVEANSTGVVSLIAVARALSNEDPGRPVTFAFLPHAYDPSAPVLPLLEAFAGSVKEAELMLVVESMGAKEALMISSAEPSNLERSEFRAHGSVVDVEAIRREGEFELSSALVELDQPAVRISTRRVVGEDESEGGNPDPARHAAATASLAGLVVDLAK